MDCGRGTTVATSKRKRTIRLVGVIVAALVALVTGGQTATLTRKYQDCQDHR